MNLRRVYAAWERKTLAKGRAEGKAEGKAEALLLMLKLRGLSVTVAQREQILECQDIARLDQWLLAAHLITDVNQLFEIGLPTRRKSSRRAA